MLLRLIFDLIGNSYRGVISRGHFSVLNPSSRPPFFSAGSGPVRFKVTISRQAKMKAYTFQCALLRWSVVIETEVDTLVNLLEPTYVHGDSLSLRPILGWEGSCLLSACRSARTACALIIEVERLRIHCAGFGLNLALLVSLKTNGSVNIILDAQNLTRETINFMRCSTKLIYRVDEGPSETSVANLSEPCSMG
jgi:hypothetical protein